MRPMGEGVDTGVQHVLAQALPGYDVGAVIGRGSWGTVVAARHRRLERDVAVKLLDEGPLVDEHRHRFLVEARVLASLQHPHLVPVYDYVEHDGRCMLVMELLTGGSIGELLRRRQLDAPSACAAVLVALSGLGHAHAAGVLHRDVKPDNLLLSAAGTLKVADFGVALVLGDRSAAVGDQVLGSPAYMAPEQLTGEPVGPATDVYATATVLYELLSGRLPFPAEGTPLEVAARHVHADPMPLGHVAPGLPRALAAAVDRALARSPERTRSASELAQEVFLACEGAWGSEWHRGTSIALGDVALAHARPSGTSAAPPLPASAAGRPPVEAVGPRPRRRRVALGLLGAVAMAGAAGWVVLRGGGEESAPVASWAFDVGSEIVGTPAVASGLVVIGDDVGALHALDAGSGDERWRYETPRSVRSSPVVADGVVYVGGFDGYVHAVDLGSGQRRWRAAVGHEIFSSPTVADGRVVVAADEVLALDASTGEVAWKFPLSAPSVASPVVAGDSVVIGASDGVVRGLDLRDGTRRWEVETRGPVASTASVADGVAYVGSGDGSVYAIEVGDGSQRWRAATGDGVNSSPLVVGDLVVFGSRDGKVHAVDRASGEDRWAVDVGARVESRPTVVDGTIVVGDNAGTVYGLEPRSGDVRWRLATGSPVLNGVARVGDGFVHAGGDGEVQRFAS